MTVTPAIRHEPKAQRFVADVDGGAAYIAYRELEGRVLDLDSTFVPRAARRRNCVTFDGARPSVRARRRLSRRAELPVRGSLYRAPPGVPRSAGLRYASNRAPTGTRLVWLRIGTGPRFETGVASKRHGGRLE